MKPEIIIIGAGPAGLTAALYACRYGLAVTIFEALAEGGQLTSTPEVDNYPGVPHIDGFTLAESMKKQAVEAGAVIRHEAVTAIELEGKKVITASGEYQASTLLLANGAKRRKLECEGEEKFTGKGVSYCATCDGAFFRGKDVAIVGGGNTALEDALFLSRLCKTVYLIHRRDSFRGMDSLSKAVLSAPNILFCKNSRISEIRGDTRVNEILLVSEGEEDRGISVSAIFVAIGTIPDTELLRGQLPLDTSGYVIAGEDCKTMLPGVFVAGDCRKKPLRQIVTATADGAVAAFEAANYCSLEG